jgi:ParB-like chromosome segregation protein Spo0J
MEEEKKQKLELKINSEIERLTPEMTEVEFQRLKQSIREYGLKIPIEVMSDGTIIDGHHRYRACKELGIEPTYHINKDVTTIEQAKVLARELNDSRRQMNLPRRILCAYQTYKEKLEQEAKERQLAHLKQYQKSPSVSRDTNGEKGRTREKLAKQLNIAPATLARAFKIIELAPHQYLQLWLDGRIPTNTMAIAVEALESIPDEYKSNKEELIRWTLEDPEKRILEVKKILGNTNAVIAMIEGERDEVREKLEERYKSLYYTPELDPEEVLWFAEEISQSSHKLTRGIKLAEEIGETWEEAEAWFAHYGGRCIREVKAWLGEWDKYQEELERKGKFKIGDRSDDNGT